MMWVGDRNMGIISIQILMKVFGEDDIVQEENGENVE